MKRNKVVEYIKPHLKLYFSGGSVVKNLPVSVGDTGSIPGSGRSPGRGNGNPLPVVKSPPFNTGDVGSIPGQGTKISACFRVTKSALRGKY